jgi:hypothetical protein
MLFVFMTADEIIQALTDYTPRFPGEALSEAPQHREELIPRLLDSLDYVAENLKTLMNKNPDYQLHFFAMFLLARFREQRAFPKLVHFLHKNEDELDFILGDVLTEHYKAILCSTYNGDISLLRNVIENDAYYEFARDAAMHAYVYIVLDGHISREELTDYLRHVIRGLKDDDTVGATLVVDTILDKHIFDLLPEAKSLYDRELVNSFICGSYDIFISHIFDYTYDSDEKIHINDEDIAKIGSWASYQPKIPFEPEPVSLPAKPAAAAEMPKKKIGRNDPCPCGSGKKYKKCCLPKGITFKGEIEEKETAAIPKNTGNSDFDFRALYDDTKPYNLLSGYPGLDPNVKEGEHKFTEFFSPQAIEIDVPVYKALHRRAIPMWVRRNNRQEDLERIDLLLDAFTLFTQARVRDGIDSLDAFDEKYMVHYHAAYWINCLYDLLDEYETEIPREQYAMLETISQTLERMRQGDQE